MGRRREKEEGKRKNRCGETIRSTTAASDREWGKEGLLSLLSRTSPRKDGEGREKKRGGVKKGR